MHIATPLLCLVSALLVAAERPSHASARSHKGLLRRFGAAHSLEPRHGEAGSSLSARRNGELQRRAYSGRATYYAAGLGACGTTNTDSDYIVAMNPSQFDGNCYRTITIGYQGKTATASVTDLCPGCPYEGIDMSQGLFEHFADTSTGVIQVQWAWGNSLEDKPKTTSTTQRRTSTSRPPPPPSSTSTRSSTHAQPTSTSSSSSSTPSSSSSESETSTSTSTQASTTPVGNFDGLGRVVGVMFDMANAGQDAEAASATSSPAA